MVLLNSTDPVSSDDDDSTLSVPALLTPEDRIFDKLDSITTQLQCLIISHSNLIQQHRQLQQEVDTLRESTQSSSNNRIPLPFRDQLQQQLYLGDQVKVVSPSRRNTQFYGVTFAKISHWDSEWVHLLSTDHPPSSDPKKGYRKPHNLLRIGSAPAPSSPVRGSSSTTEID